MLHALKEVFYTILLPKQCQLIDQLVQRWGKLPKQVYVRSYYFKYPHLLFLDGITTLTETSATTKVGIMFALVLTCITVEGRKMLSKINSGLLNDHLDMIHIFEMLLCYWSWLKKDQYWKIGDKQSSKNAEQLIVILLQNIQDLFPWSTGSQWNIPKFHDQLHIP